ncbi:MAG: glycosyltransferase family 8 protein [Pseudomonadota bacterium]
MRPTPDSDEVVLAFGVDAGYAPHLGVVLASIIDNAPGVSLRVHVLNNGLPDELRAKVQRCAPDAQFHWHNLDDQAVTSLEGSGHISSATYYRLMIPEIVPQDVHRVIYLDVDLVVTGDIRELWSLDLHGQPIGAVADPGVDAQNFADRMDLPQAENGYFNAGVLVIDLDALTEDGLRPAINILRTRREDCPFMDQDALNAVFWTRWAPVDYAWNIQRVICMRDDGLAYYAAPDIFNPDRRPKIIHFTTQIKPWHADGYHRFTWKYFQYLKQTPFWRDISKAAELTLIKSLRRRARTWLNWQTLKP